MFEEWIVAAIATTMIVLVIFMATFWVRGNVSEEEVKRLQKMLREKNQSIFYSVTFLGKNLKLQEKEITKTTYDIVWKVQRSNGTYNDKLRLFPNGLYPKKWYVFEMREAEEYETWDIEIPSTPFK